MDPAITSLDALNSLLRGEISSVETYTQALSKIQDLQIQAQLEDCRASHLHRAQALKTKIQELGGRASEGSGVWGAFSKLVEGGAKVFGMKAAISALEQGEDFGKKDYQTALPKLAPELRSFVEAQLWPEQEKTHQIVSNLKHTVH